ncbi:hypothetical protein PV10_00156 [Exophiala mesophila]|uniref:Cytochrome P450 n=1 Tax=Exophiala mesophila TaxID=212818 RepID=A0A0D2ABG3_EXOME|nr:uncharacterized protein PV10_00156 [Exophiala mesophila]KIV96273.1 hypothetical protein PV10_00156 [Exophiala mesophila]
MRHLILLAVAALVVHYIVNYALCFRRNLNKAKRSGIPYIIAPVYAINSFWLVTNRLWLPLLAKLPRKWTKSIDYCLPDFPFRCSIEIFQRTGYETFLVVSPGGNILHTAEPAVISQITTRRTDFPKPIHIYRALDVYGKNVVSTEGGTWRRHRKATSPPFTEKNNHLVWAETIDQASNMLASWLGPDGKGNQTVHRVMDDTMRLSLYVISRAGFGRKLKWPAADSKVDVDDNYVDLSKIQNHQDDMDAGHSMSYTYALHCLLDNILLQLVMPRWLMARLPVKAVRKANEAYTEWGNYMKEAVSSKKASLKKSDGGKESMDILGQLVKGQVASEGVKNAKDHTLTDTDIEANVFILILAGHETAANSIHFALVYLALHPQYQVGVHKDLDRIFQGRAPSEWDYDRDLPGLFGGMVGAVLAEELRLVPPVVGIPKSTMGVGEQTLTVDGKTCTVPSDTYINLAITASQRNPKYWPAGKPIFPGGRPVHPKSNLDNDLEEFRPDRWLLDENRDAQTTSQTATPQGKEMPDEVVAGDGLGINEAADTSEHLFRPVRGSYLPFSDGYRACLGRRFAQVEVLTALAVLLQNHSVELAVDDWASDEEVIEMDQDARAEVWQKAASHARNLMLNGLAVIISLQMRTGHVAMRFVPRGQEKFPNNVDEIWKSNHPELQTLHEPNQDWVYWTEGRPSRSGRVVKRDK